MTMTSKAVDGYIGIDHGSTNFKAGLYDLGGALLAESSRPLDNIRLRPGIVEQDPRTWRSAMLEVFGDLIGAVPGTRIKAIGACTQVSSHIFVDAQGIPLTNVIQWQDLRTAGYVEELNGRIADAQSGFHAGFTIDATATVARAKWACTEEPDLWERTRYILNPKDYINLLLTGVVGGDPLSAYDAVGPDGNYVEGMEQLVPGILKRLPPLSEFRRPLGPVQPLGDPAIDQALRGAVVAVGTMDVFGNLYGSGAYRAGDAIEVCGTCEIVGVLSQELHPTPGVVQFPKLDDLYFHAGPTKSGGASTQWIAGILGLTLREVDSLAADAPPGSGGLVFLPYLEGERAPLWDSEARGLFLGLSDEHDRRHFCRAVLEGVAFSARHLLEEIDKAAGFRAGTVRISGGGSNSDVGCQIRADILGRSLERIHVRNSGMIGAVTIAAVACGDAADLGRAAAELVHVDRTFAPNPANRERYDALYRIYRDAYTQMKPLYKQLSAYRAGGGDNLGR